MSPFEALAGYSALFGRPASFFVIRSLGKETEKKHEIAPNKPKKPLYSIQKNGKSSLYISVLLYQNKCYV